MVSTPDGGTIWVGNTLRTDPRIKLMVNNEVRCWSNWDLLVVKTNSTGAVESQFVMGGPGQQNPFTTTTQVSGTDTARDVKPVSSGGYLVVGSTTRPVADNSGSDECWLIKLNSQGTVDWQKAFGSTGQETCKSFVEDPLDGSFVVVGDYNVGTHPNMAAQSGIDLFVSKISSNGDVLWAKKIGETGTMQSGFSIETDGAGGYIVAGVTNSTITKKSGRYSYPSIVSHGLILRMDANGSVIWQKKIGAQINSIVKAPDGNFIISGDVEESSFITLAKPKRGQTAQMLSADGYVAKMDINGNMLAQYAYGSQGTSYSWDLLAGGTGGIGDGFAFTGTTILKTSTGGIDLDAWVVKTDDSLNVPFNASSQKKVTPLNLATTAANLPSVDLAVVIYGTTEKVQTPPALTMENTTATQVKLAP